MITAKQNQKFPFHFLSAPPTPPPAEKKKGKENFWVLHTRVHERVRGALVRITTQSERTRQFQVTTRSARAKSGGLLVMGSNFFKQTPPNETCSELRKRIDLAGAKIALSIFSKPFPSMAEAVNSQSSPQLHESVLSLRMGSEPIFWKNSL